MFNIQRSRAQSQTISVAISIVRTKESAGWGEASTTECVCSPLTYNITLLVYSVWYDTAVVLYDHRTTVLYCTYIMTFTTVVTSTTTYLDTVSFLQRWKEYLYTVIVIILQDRRVNGTQFNDWIHYWISGVI